MTGKEEDELGRLQAAQTRELVEYVKLLMKREYQYGYEEGWNDGADTYTS